MTVSEMSEIKTISKEVKEKFLIIQITLLGDPREV